MAQIYPQILVKEWAKRLEAGPYNKKGDVSPNTPDDGERVRKNKDAFLANPTQARWTPEGTGPVPFYNAAKTTEGKEVPHKGKVSFLLDAAFYANLKNDAGIKEKVKSELLWFARNKRLNFSDPKIWIPNGYNDGTPVFEVSIMLNMLLYAYEFTESAYSEAEKKELGNWFINAATFLVGCVDGRLKSLFKERYIELEKYEYIGSKEIRAYTHKDGTPILSAGLYYNNRRAHMIQVIGLVGLKFGRQDFSKVFDTYFKETLAFASYPDGTFGETERGNIKLPSKGISYLANTFGSLAAVAIPRAWNGDKSLVDFTTTLNLNPKTGKVEKQEVIKGFKWALIEHAKYIKGEKDYYVAEGKIGELMHKIDGTHAGWIMMHDVNQLSIANMYYKDDFLKASYTRDKNNGFEGYPSTALATNGTEYVYDGLVGHPAGLLQFGLMEGNPSNPFNVSNPDPRPVIDEAKIRADEAARVNAEWKSKIEAEKAAQNKEIELLLLAEQEEMVELRQAWETLQAEKQERIKKLEALRT